MELLIFSSSSLPPPAAAFPLSLLLRPFCHCSRCCCCVPYVAAAVLTAFPLSVQLLLRFLCRSCCVLPSVAAAAAVGRRVWEKDIFQMTSSRVGEVSSAVLTAAPPPLPFLFELSAAAAAALRRLHNTFHAPSSSLFCCCCCCRRCSSFSLFEPSDVPLLLSLFCCFLCFFPTSAAAAVGVSRRCSSFSLFEPSAVPLLLLSLFLLHICCCCCCWSESLAAATLPFLHASSKQHLSLQRDSSSLLTAATEKGKTFIFFRCLKRKRSRLQMSVCSSRNAHVSATSCAAAAAAVSCETMKRNSFPSWENS